MSNATCRVTRAHIVGALGPAISSTALIAPTAWCPQGGRRRCPWRVLELHVASEARTPASAGTPGSLDRVSRHFVRCELLRVPATVDDDRVAVSARLESSSSRRVLSGDILVASGVQRTAVQRPPTLRLIKRVSHADCVHTRVKNSGGSCSTRGRARAASRLQAAAGDERGERLLDQE